MSSITTIKMLRTVDIKLIPNRFFALCIGIIMLACANTCIAQETELFKLVKNVAELQEGDTVIVVNNTNEHCSALSTKWGSRKIEGYKIDINGELLQHRQMLTEYSYRKLPMENGFCFLQHIKNIFAMIISQNPIAAAITII